MSWIQQKFRLQRFVDGYGTVCGLAVRCHPLDDGNVIVEPGYAIDCCGQDIIVCEPTVVDIRECINACGLEDPCKDAKRRASEAYDQQRKKAELDQVSTRLETTKENLRKRRDAYDDYITELRLLSTDQTLKEETTRMDSDIKSHGAELERLEKELELAGRPESDVREHRRLITDLEQRLERKLQDWLDFTYSRFVLSRAESNSIRVRCESCITDIKALQVDVSELKDQEDKLREETREEGISDFICYFLTIAYKEESKELVPVIVSMNGCNHTPVCEPSRICESYSFCVTEASCKESLADMEFKEWRERVRQACSPIIEELKKLPAMYNTMGLLGVPGNVIRDTLVRHLKQNPPYFDCDLINDLCQMSIEYLDWENPEFRDKLLRILIDCKCRLTMNTCHDCCSGTGVRLAQITIEAQKTGQLRIATIDNIPPARRTLRHDWPPYVSGYVSLADIFCLPLEEACAQLSAKGIHIESVRHYDEPVLLDTIEDDLIPPREFIKCGGSVELEVRRNRIITVRIVKEPPPPSGGGRPSHPWTPTPTEEPGTPGTPTDGNGDTQIPGNGNGGGIPDDKPDTTNTALIEIDRDVIWANEPFTIKVTNFHPEEFVTLKIEKGADLTRIIRDFQVSDAGDYGEQFTISVEIVEAVGTGDVVLRAGGDMGSHAEVQVYLNAPRPETTPTSEGSNKVAIPRTDIVIDRELYEKEVIKNTVNPEEIKELEPSEKAAFTRGIGTSYKALLAMGELVMGRFRDAITLGDEAISRVRAMNLEEPEKEMIIGEPITVYSLSDSKKELLSEIPLTFKIEGNSVQEFSKERLVGTENWYLDPKKFLKVLRGEDPA